MLPFDDDYIRAFVVLVTCVLVCHLQQIIIIINYIKNK